MNVVLASGLAILEYKDVQGVIEALINTEGRRYPIPGLDHDDIAQEIRLESFRVLEFYDSRRIGPSPYKYLQICIRNFLYNMRRGIWVPNNPPCVRCPLWDRINRTCSIDEVGCEKIAKYRQKMAIKADLRSPSSMEDDNIVDDIQFQQMEANSLDQSIREALPPELINYYDKMLLGDTIPARAKKKIREIASEIVNNA